MQLNLHKFYTRLDFLDFLDFFTGFRIYAIGETFYNNLDAKFVRNFFIHAPKLFVFMDFLHEFGFIGETLYKNLDAEFVIVYRNFFYTRVIGLFLTFVHEFGFMRNCSQEFGYEICYCKELFYTSVWNF